MLYIIAALSGLLIFLCSYVVKIKSDNVRKDEKLKNKEEAEKDAKQTAINTTKWATFSFHALRERMRKFTRHSK